MAAHTYWRLYIGAKQNLYAQMGTVSFLNAAQVNQSTGGTATASSEYDGSWAAGKAFDGNPASEWASAGVSGSEWIAYQHPSPVDIVFVGVKVSSLYPVSGLALQYSDDGVSWSAASPLYLLAGQPELTTGSYTVLGLSTSRRPLVVVDGRIRELPDSDTLPPQAPAAHSHATSDVAGLQSVLDAKAPILQPTLTGLREVKVAMAANNIDVATGNLFTKTISGTTTLTVSNVPVSGTLASFILDLTNGGSAAITWWSGVKWAGGVAPTLTAAGRDVLGFYTHDGGTTWTGLLLGKDVK